MGADIGGLGKDHFKIELVSLWGPVREMKPDQVNEWEWQITPKGDEALGVNKLKVSIYYPDLDSAGRSYNQLVGQIEFQVEVTEPPKSLRERVTGFFQTTRGVIVALASAVAAVTGAIIGILTILDRRSKRSAKTSQSTEKTAPQAGHAGGQERSAVIRGQYTARKWIKAGWSERRVSAQPKLRAVLISGEHFKTGCLSLFYPNISQVIYELIDFFHRIEIPDHA
jgi:hypothetical protein